MTGHRTTAVVAAGIALVAAAVATVAFVHASKPDDAPGRGPMVTPVEHGMVIPGQKGSTFTDGFEVLRLKGSDPVTIVSVRSVGGDGTFTYLGAKIAGPERQIDAVNYLLGYPPKDSDLGRLIDAEGATIMPRSDTQNGRGYELLLGYEIRDDTRVGFRSAAEVTYTVNGETYLWSSPGRLLYCPEGRSSSDCSAEAEEVGWGE